MYKKILLSLVFINLLILPVFSYQDKKPRTLSNSDFSSPSSSSPSSSPTSSETPSETPSDLTFDPEDILSNTIHFTKEQRLEAGRALIEKISKWKPLGKLTGKNIRREPIILELFKRIDKEKSSYDIALKISGTYFLNNKFGTLVYLFNQKTLKEQLQVLDDLKADGTGKANFINKSDTNGICSRTSYFYNEFRGKPAGVHVEVNYPSTNFESPNNSYIKRGFPKVEFEVEELDCSFELNQIPAIKKFFSAGLN